MSSSALNAGMETSAALIVLPVMLCYIPTHAPINAASNYSLSAFLSGRLVASIGYIQSSVRTISSSHNRKGVIIVKLQVIWKMENKWQCFAQ